MRSMLYAALLAVALVGCGEKSSEQPTRFALGKPAPPLGVERIIQPADGANMTWEALRGKVVVLEFWATWCGPCVAAIAHLNELADKFKDRPVQFIAITDESEDVVRRFLARKPMKAWVALDTDRSMFDHYRVEGIPKTILVDDRGIVVGVTYPMMLSTAALENVLAGRPAGLPEPPPDAETVAARAHAEEESTPSLVSVSIRRMETTEGYTSSTDSFGWEFRGCTLRTLIETVYDALPYQISLPEDLTRTYFYAKAKAAAGREAVRPLLQSAITSGLGLTLRRETRQLAGYRLIVPAAGAHKLKPAPVEAGTSTHPGWGTDADGMMNYTMSNVTAADLCAGLSRFLGCPLRAESSLEGRFDVLLTWKDGDRDDLLRAVRDHLGLEVQPEECNIEMLIFEHAGDTPPTAYTPTGS